MTDKRMRGFWGTLGCLVRGCLEPRRKVLTGDFLPFLLTRCESAERDGWEVEKPIHERRFPFLGYRIVFRRTTNARPHAEARSADSVQADVGGSES